MSNTNDFVIENGVLEKYIGSDENVVIPKGITEIADYAFDCCEDMVDVDIPDTVGEIGEGAFSSCTELRSVRIPYGVTEIKEGTFATCISLESVEIPCTVGMIGECAFSECRSLRTVVIPEGVKNIEEEAFGFCEDLVITIPDSIEWIYPFTFKHSKNITIKGSSGSKAEEYAEDYGFKFEKI